MNYNDLQVGDIVVLNKQKRSIYSYLVSFFTRSKAYHVELIISRNKHDDDRITITADMDTGVALNMLKHYDRDGIKYSIYRLKEGLSDEQKKDLYIAAQSYIGKKYDVKGAIGVLIPFLKHSGSREFCSELVANIYSDVGITLFNKKSDKVLPKDFLNCDKLIKVF